MTNRTAIKLAEYNKIDSALCFILDVVIDLRLLRSRDYLFFALICLFHLNFHYCSVLFVGYPYYPTFRLSDLSSTHIRSDNRGSTVSPFRITRFSILYLEIFLWYQNIYKFCSVYFNHLCVGAILV